MGRTTQIIPISKLLTLTVIAFFSLQPCLSVKTVVVDGLDVQQAPTIHVEEALVFEHLQNLYLFHSRRAFDLCIFVEATLIFDGSSNSTRFMWHAPRPGHYYFSTRVDGSTHCDKGEKVPVRVITPDISSPASSPLPAPPPTAGGDLPALPSPASLSNSPSMAPDTAPLQPRDAGPSPRSAASSGTGIPFISSNPAVPLPTGETDTATIRPLPTPGDDESQQQQVVGLGSSLRVGVAAMAVVSVMMSSVSL